ncbi:PREDICTED: reticulocyte-binding protein 2 homolog a-like [Nicrophorus vespilloides]|uniref:Reticulocyte-binding protein 2 homolog a-like n=1 Tax=Nicrophorus vespilloides TaxID=110193 RepID=A0ABM1LZX0_NICVS|nr:PREDICTED: reticulocyte-binding protein 2 homolog a-like [Nicrophorus vespilloides]
MLDILEELNDEINSTIEYTTQSTIQTEFSTEESSTDPIITLEDKFEFDALDDDNQFNTTEFEVDLKDNSYRNSTDEASTNPISSLENEDAFEALNNDNNFNTTESVFENVSQDKAESNSTDTISKLDEENVVEDIEYSLLTTQANLNATVEDSSIELENSNNSLLTTQSTMHVQTELKIQNETDVALNEKDNLEKPDEISFDTVDLEQGATTDDTLLTTQVSLDIQTESDQESIEINELVNSSNPDEKLENQNELVETDTEKIIDISLSESSSSMNETVIDNSTELNNVTNSVILESDTTDNILLTSQSELEEAQTQVDIDEVTTKIVDEFEKQNIDLQSGLIDNALLTTQSVVDVETESQKLSGSEQNTISINEILETTTQIYNNMGGIVEEVTTGINNYDFNSTEEIITEETSPNTIETVETSTYVDVNEISTESVTIVKVQELEKEFVEKNKESETGNEDVNSLENVKEMINKYNSLETESDSQNVDVLKEVDFENEESFIDIMHSSEDEWNANKDLFTTRSSTVVTENVDEDKMFTLSESVAEEINPIVVENEMEIESDRISGTTGRVETSTSESLHTVETELNLNNKEEVDDLSAEETGIDKVIVDNDLEEEDVANTTEQASNKRIHQEVVTKTVPIEESTKSSVVIDESDEADITSLNNAESSEDETRSSTELETVIPIENNGRFIFDLLTTTVTPLYEETTDSPTEKPTKDRLSEEKINLDEEIISPEVEKTTDHTSTTDKSIDIKNDAVFYNINLKPISNNDRHNILLNLKEESSSSDEIVDYLETISEDGDYIKETGDDSEEISNDKLDEIFNYSEEFEETLNEIEEILEENSEDAPYITTTVSNHNKQQCLSLNISMSIKINETNIVVPDTAKISGNCSEYFIVSWKSAFDPAENNSIHFNLIRKDDCVYLQSIGVHVMKDDGESFIDEANDDLNLDADDTNYVMLNNGLSVQLDMSLKRKNVALEKPTTLKSTNTLALQITSGIASILILLVVVGVFIYRRHRGQTRILKVTIDK